jgi:hypothetical protein
MEETTVPVSQARPVGGWQRVGLPCLFLVNAALSLWADGFHRFEWLPWACMGVAWLTLSARKKGEPFLAFLRKPRNLVTYALLIVGIVGFGRNLYLMYMKHFG